MRILFLTAQPPEPPHAGGALRVSGLMRGVHQAGHEAHLCTFATDDQLAAAHPALNAYCASVTAVPPPERSLVDRLRTLLFSSKADMQCRFLSEAYGAALRALLARQQFDLFQIESLEMAVYLPILQEVQPGTPVIYDAFNAEYELQQSIYEAEKDSISRLPGRIYSRIQWRRLVHFERDVCRAVSHVIAVSRADADAFNRLHPTCGVSVVPNGIDVEAFASAASVLDLGQHALVFTGSMGYRPNVDAAIWFADHVLDRVRAEVPDATFFIVGSQPHRRLDSLREREGVEITGWVPDVNAFLHAAAVYVVPLRMGSGTRLKLLQAMAAGLAVVSTRLGAQGLQVREGRELLLADRADQFAAAVIGLLRDPERRRALGEQAAAYVRAHHDWSSIIPDLLAVYAQIVPGAASAPPERTASP